MQDVQSRLSASTGDLIQAAPPNTPKNPATTVDRPTKLSSERTAATVTRHALMVQRTAATRFPALAAHAGRPGQLRSLISPAPTCHHRRPKRPIANTTTSKAIAITTMPIVPHKVDVSTVMRKLADSESPPAALARIVV